MRFSVIPDHASLGVNATAVGVGLALMLPGLGALWKAGPLRGEFHNEWAERIDLTEAGLSEVASNVLRRLRDVTDERLGTGEAGNFSPDNVIGDPGPLVAITTEFNELITARSRLKRRFNLLLRAYGLCPLVPLPYLIGVILAFLYLGNLTSKEWLAPLGFSLIGLSVLAGLVILSLHLYCHRRLTTAEILARPALAGSGAPPDHD